MNKPKSLFCSDCLAEDEKHVKAKWFSTDGVQLCAKHYNHELDSALRGLKYYSNFKVIK